MGILQGFDQDLVEGETSSKVQRRLHAFCIRLTRVRSVVFEVVAPVIIQCYDGCLRDAYAYAKNPANATLGWNPRILGVLFENGICEVTL